MPSLARCVHYIRTTAETGIQSPKEERIVAGTRTDKIPHLLETPSVTIPTEYRSCIVRKGNGVCPKAVDRNRAKRLGDRDTGRLRNGSEERSRARFGTGGTKMTWGPVH